MKKFFANAQNGVFTTNVSAADIQAKPAFASELINSAFTEGKAYVVTHKDAEVRNVLATSLQEQFMDRLNDILTSTEDLGSTEMIDALRDENKLSKDIHDWVIDTLEARKNPVLPVVLPKTDVVIPSNIQMKPEQVLLMMATQGLVIGQPCTYEGKSAVVIAFEVFSGGVMAYIMLDDADGPSKVVVNSKLVGLAPALPVAQATANKTNSKESVSTMKTVNEVKNELELAIDPEAKAVVEKALEEEVPAYELSAEERAAMAELKLAQDLAKFSDAQQKQGEKASQVANSSGAMAILNQFGIKPQAPAAPAPAQPATPAASTGAPVVDKKAASSARQATNNARQAAGVPATQNTNQTNGGNVQMTTQTQGAQTRKAGGAGADMSALQGKNVTPAMLAALKANGTLELDPSTVAPAATFEYDTTDFELNEYVGNGNAGSTDFVWYLEAMKQYETVLSAADFAQAGKKNEALGITNVEFYTPASVKARNSRRFFRDDEVLVMEMFFGNTSYEFIFARRESDRGAYIFSRNIARKQRENGNGYFCEYNYSRRSDKLQVVIQADGKIREARKTWNSEKKVYEIHAEDAPFVMEVGGESYVDTNLGFNVRIGQATFVQAMILADSLLGLKKARETKVQA